jgi:hypothetical protein
LSGLVDTVRSGEADMAVARFELPAARGGFGLAKKVAVSGIFRLTGMRLEAPLSGQRAVRSELLRSIGDVPSGFGIEVGLTIDAARLGYRICEVPLPLRHRETGKTVAGFWHRGTQMAAIARTILTRWVRPAP